MFDGLNKIEVDQTIANAVNAVRAKYKRKDLFLAFNTGSSKWEVCTLGESGKVLAQFNSLEELNEGLKK